MGIGVLCISLPYTLIKLKIVPLIDHREVQFNPRINREEDMDIAKSVHAISAKIIKVSLGKNPLGPIPYQLHFSLDCITKHKFQY
jgi:hypothetical protein